MKDPAQVLGIVAKLPALDIVFCDLEMPKMNGYSLLVSLRKVLPENIPVICVSVHLSELDRAFGLGFDGFVGKPLSENFPHQLKQFLAGQPVWELP